MNLLLCGPERTYERITNLVGYVEPPRYIHDGSNLYRYSDRIEKGCHVYLWVHCVNIP